MDTFPPRTSHLTTFQRFLAVSSLTGIFAMCFTLCAVLVFQASTASDAAAQGRGRRVRSEAMQQRYLEMQRSGNFTAEQLEQIRRRGEQAMAAQAGPGQNGGEENESENANGESEEGDNGDEESKEGDGEDDNTIKAPTADSVKANPQELNARPNEDGLVEFSFHGQPWPDVLQWYSEVSRLSLNWQELPDDTLNLTTQRPYTVEETRDLLNSQLLARGFTMIAKGNLLWVMKIDKLDPSLIPRVDPDDLEDSMPHEFVRVRFDVPTSMEPAKAQEDATILLSPNAKATPLLASRRLLIIDAVANLRDVRDLLYSEQLAAERDIRPVEYRIVHRRADYVVQQVMIVMGMDPEARKSPQELQVEQQRMQIIQQMAKQNKDVSKMISPDAPPVHFAVDRHTNTIMVSAPPKELKVVERAIKMFDAPYGAAVGAGGAQMEFREYTVKTVRTDAIVDALKEIGTLHPLTQLQSGDRSTIFATAPPSDHEKIASVIEQLDGKGRKLYPIQLSRRYRALEVAGTVHTLMVGEDENSSNSRNLRYVYNYNYGSSSDEDNDEFRIQPDVERNRLLLWATEEEYEEVVKLLQSLGAISDPNAVSSGGDRLRVLEQRSPEETARLLEQLRQVMGDDVEIVAPPQQQSPGAESPSDSSKQQQSAPESEPSVSEDQITRFDLQPFQKGQRRTWLAQTSVPADGAAADDGTANEAAGANDGEEDGATAQVDSRENASADAERQAADQAADRPKVKIIVTEDGRILLDSTDPIAADRVERLIEEMEPPRDDFEIFYIKHVDAFDVHWNLEEYFEEELADNSNDRLMRALYGYGGGGEADPTLGRAPKLRFIYDPDSNSVLVQNASQAQLQVIRKLVNVYDQPIKQDDVATRRTEAIPIVYSRATDIATALKEAYRDLLSSKDKEFENREGNQGRSGRQQVYRLSLTGEEDNDRKSPVKVQFEGALAIGVDEVSNTLIVSAEANIFDNIVTIVKQLDQGANPKTTVALHEVNGSIDADGLREALQSAISQPWTGGNPEEQGGGRQRGRRNNNRRRRGR